MRTHDFGELISDVEVLRTGTHTASSGDQVTFTAADLDKIAAAYRPDFHEAPVVIGHPADNQPAFGWVKGLKRVGERLLATLDVLPAFAETLRQGLFKKRSASIYADLDGQGPYLRHVGFLGAMPPAIKALADINLNDGADSQTFEFARKEDQPMSWKDKVKNLFTQAVDEIPEGVATPGASAALAMPPATPVQFSEAEVKARETAAAEAAAKRARDEAVAEFAEQQRQKDAQTTLAAHQTAVKAKLDDLVKNAKVAPAWIKSGLTEFVEALPWGDAALVEFADAKGKTTKKAPCDWFLEFLDGLPKFINLDEVAGRDKDTARVGGAGAKLEILTKQKLAANKGMAYAVAFAEVQTEHPDLAADYVSELKGGAA